MEKLIANRYAQYEQLGRGGLGTVYRGIDTLTEIDIAIKHLRPDMADEEQIARFRREGAALRDLNHPNIVKMLDAIEEDGNYYLVMEYVSGGDLNQLLEQGYLAPEQVVSMGIDLADALTRAHKLGIIHRDLKPANVLIATDGTLRLTDFGIAHVVHQETVSEQDGLIGTIDYMAPESLSGEEAHQSMDIWAFGVMLYEMLTNQRPFNRSNITETLLAISYDPVPDIRDYCENLPHELEDLIYRMLERDTHTRISSVRYIGAILEDIKEGRSTALKQTSRFESSSSLSILPKNHNLPIQVTDFVGREAELQEIQRLLDNASIRLVTILAPGGMGKTRLSLELARRNLEKFADGIFFVELAGLSAVHAIIPAIAEAIGYSLSDAKGREQEVLLNYLSTKSILLVLDNYEHLLEAADLVGKILSSAATVTIIVTSRQRLNQSGETLFHLSGMDFPDWETPADASNYAAVKLFMGSANRNRPGFELTVENLPYVARICRLVQGMPLGIVLSASWLAVLEPHEIAAEIAEGIDFLEAEGGDLPDRQRSIRVVFDYAWQMLSDSDQAVFMTLSIFQGGFTREAAQDVTGTTIRQLMKLVNLSLLMRDTDSGRYQIHALLRQYTREKLHQSGQFEVIREKHARYYGKLIAENFQSIINQASGAVALGTLEFENIKAAWYQDVDAGDGQIINRMIPGFRLWTQHSARQDEMLQMIERAYEKFDNDAVDDLIRGNILVVYGITRGFARHQYQASMEFTGQGIALLSNVDAKVDIAFAYGGLSMINLFQGKIEDAYAVSKKSYELGVEIAQKSIMANAAAQMGYISLTMLGKYDESREWYEKSYELALQAGNKAIASLASYNLGEIYFLAHQFEDARKYMEAALMLERDNKGVALHAHVADGLAALYDIEGDYISAESILRDSVQRAENSRQLRVMNMATGMLASYYVRRARYRDAEQLIKAYQSKHFNGKESPLDKAILDTFEALALWGQGDHTRPLAIIEQSVKHLSNNTQPSIYFHVLLGVMLIRVHRGEFQSALEMLGLLRAHPNWLSIRDDHALIVELDKQLKAHFSEADYIAISEAGAKQDYRATIMALDDSL